MTTLPTLDGPVVPPLNYRAPTQIVILLHGYGSNGADLISLAPHWQAALPGAVFISPNAPEICPGAPDGYQWWGLSSMDPASRAAGARAVAPTLDAFIDAQLAKYDLKPKNLALVGFSQGTMMALQVGLQRQPQIAGILGYSGMLADETGPANAKTKPPILLIHGDSDPVLPIAAFHQAGKLLLEAGFEVQGKVSPGLGHSIDLGGLQLGEQFLRGVLA